MKKILLIAVILFAGFDVANAQFQKGDISLAAKTTGFDLNFTDDIRTIQFGVTGACFATNKLAIEAGIGIYNKKYDSREEYEYFETIIQFGAGARYYLYQNFFAGMAYQGSQFRYLEIYQNSYMRTKNKSSDTANYGQFNVGLSLFVNEKVYLEPGAFYNLSLTDKFEDTYGLSLSIGIKF